MATLKQQMSQKFMKDFTVMLLKVASQMNVDLRGGRQGERESERVPV